MRGGTLISENFIYADYYEYYISDPSNDAVFVWTREQCPDNSVTGRALAKVKQCGQLSCKMETVEQSKSKCSPLDVYDIV